VQPAWLRPPVSDSGEAVVMLTRYDLDSGDSDPLPPSPHHAATADSPPTPEKPVRALDLRFLSV